MDLEAAFLDDIVAHPHDPVPWLVFADWLEERDDARGELVRLLRRCWDAPQTRALDKPRARLRELFAAGVRLPLPHFTNSLGSDFVWVPPGRFWPGGSEGTPGRRRVDMPTPYWLATTQTTQRQWRAVMGASSCYFERTGEGAERVADVADADLEAFPVESVSWNEVQQFLARLNDAERHDGWTYRLPTEVEWEYACRGPVTCRADCGFTFYAGEPSNSLSPEQANFDGREPIGTPPGQYLQRTARVGSYPPNRLGLYDMHGNVFEWLSSGWARQRRERPIRGGCWFYPAYACTGNYHNTLEPQDGYGNVGFRLARVPTSA